MPSSKVFSGQGSSLHPTSPGLHAEVGPPVEPESPRAGRYQLLRRHRRGGLGEVFVAVDLELGREVALKEIKPEYADDAQFRERFLREAEITSRLEHPGIVPVYGLGHRNDGAPFYAMRFIRGDTFQHAIEAFHRGPLDFESLAFRQLLQRFVTACQTVAYAHDRGVIHRDLKPDNIMLGPFGEVLVIDWGLARDYARTPAVKPDVDQQPTSRKTGSDGRQTEQGIAQGTPAYMAPEQAAGHWDLVGPATDVYALGGVLYCLLTGLPPIAGSDSGDILRRAVSGDVPPARMWRPSIPLSLEKISHRALDVHRERRYGSALELAAECERYLADDPVQAHPESVVAWLRRWLRRHGKLAVGLLAGLTLAAFALTVATIRVSSAHSSVTVARDRERAAREAEAFARREVESQRDMARTERNAAREQKRRARQAFDSVMSEEMVAWLAAQPSLTANQNKFLTQALGYYQEFAAEVASNPVERSSLALAHDRAGYLLVTLGRPNDGLAAYRTAEELQQHLVDESPTNPQWRAEWARTQSNIGRLFRILGDHVAAERMLQASLAQYQTVIGQKPDSLEWRAEQAHTLNVLGSALSDRGDLAGAESAFRSALSIRERLRAADPERALWRLDVAATQTNLAMLLQVSGKWEASEHSYRSAIALQEVVDPANPADKLRLTELAKSYSHYAMLLSDQHKLVEAASEHRKAIALFEQLVSAEPSIPRRRVEMARNYNALAAVYENSGKLEEAELAFRAAIRLQEVLRKELSDSPEPAVELAGTLCNLGGLIRAKDPPEAMRLHHQAVTLLTPINERDPRQIKPREFLQKSLWSRGKDWTLANDYRAALADYDRALALLRGEDCPPLQRDRAECLARLGDHVRAVAIYEPQIDQLTGGSLYDVACGYAVCAKAAHDDAALTERYAARAVSLLRQSIATGYSDLPNILGDPDLNVLRDRADFAAVMWDVADTVR